MTYNVFVLRSAGIEKLSAGVLHQNDTRVVNLNVELFHDHGNFPS